MGLISKNKDRLIGLLRFLNDKPGFRRLFYWIHEIRCTPFKPRSYISTLIDNSFMLGVFNIDSSPAWRRMAMENFEPAETMVVRSMFPYFNTFIDIGGHIGYFTCMVGVQHPNSKILVFEPNPDNFKALKMNIKINGLDDVDAFNIGLSNEVGSVPLFGTDAMSSINQGSFAGTQKAIATVEVDRLDNYINKVQDNSPVFIKMDVEAKEYDVILGGLDFIKKIKPVGLMIEICDEWSGGRNPHFKDTFKLVSDLGYTPYLISESTPLQKVTDISKMIGANYLFVRKDLVSKISKETKII